jgi:hypothetical protein
MPPRGQSASSPGPRGTSGARSAPTCWTNPRGCPARGPVPERCSAARPRYRDGAHHGWAAERPAPPCGRREAASAVTPNLRLDGCERCREQDDAGRNGGPASAGHLKRAPPGPDMRGAPGPRTFTGRLGASLPQLSAAALARAATFRVSPSSCHSRVASPSGFTSPGALLTLARFRGRCAGEGPGQQGLASPSVTRYWS